MKSKCLLALLCSLSWLGNAMAETRYISDNVYAYLHAGPSNQYRIIGSINAGETVEYLNRNAESKYVQIRDGEGRTGWVDGQFVQTEESFRSRLPALEQELGDTRQQLATVDQRHRQDVADKVTQLADQEQELSKLRSQLDELSQRSEALQEENRRLSSLMDDREHNMRMDWLLRGGLVAGIGALFGFLLPLIPLRRKRRQDRWMN
ncbi:TIGR04211 family SH3 domain-containing protein [Zobellella endophytica]|uniref:TIGR04211 family SH3 domain-containing protein n=1 Tax=Zobellella endophytica TaxID=2116700 RepID=A0A2P7QTX0_9GAMM|nr:TIGR04211 family SH3 domain-containing protein [Zobellella endophytica]PSJ41414.1 TIGR04211 family SH3 domain-containing protein [Zobellella endophytica]